MLATEESCPFVLVKMGGVGGKETDEEDKRHLVSIPRIEDRGGRLLRTD